MPEHHRLQQPHSGEAQPAEGRQPEKAAAGQRGKGGPELEQDQHQGIRRQIGLNAVPGKGDQPADHRRDIGAENAKRLTTNHRVRHPGHLARLRHQVGAQLDNTDAHQQAEQNLPAGQPKCKEARRHYVAAHAVHVRHPE